MGHCRQHTCWCFHCIDEDREQLGAFSLATVTLPTVDVQLYVSLQCHLRMYRVPRGKDCTLQDMRG